MFLLKIDVVDKTSKIGIYPSADLSKIESQYVLDRSVAYFTQFLPDNVSFNGMIPNYNGETRSKNKVKYNLCDMMSFIFNEPKGIMYVISPKFKYLLDLFNLPHVKFYSGNIIANEIVNHYYIFHILTKQYDYIDFEKSTFFKGNLFLERISDTSVSGENIEEIKEQVGHRWIFNKAVMKSDYKDVDMYYLDSYQILISERLKNAIEKANLTGVKITPCPIEFHLSNEV